MQPPLFTPTLFKIAGKSRSVDTEISKPGDYVINKIPLLFDSNVYSLRIARTSSTKELLAGPPRITERTSFKGIIHKRKNRTGQSISLDMKAVQEPISASLMVICLCKAVYHEMESNGEDRGLQVDVFWDDVRDFPTLDSVEKFFMRIFTSKDLSTECAVTAVAYVDRLHQVSGIKLNQSNWRKISFISILEADKVLRDKLVWNEDYKDLISDIDLFELRKLERAFLKYIEFHLTLSQSDYAKYYFDLISLRDSETDPFSPEKGRQGKPWCGE